MVPSRDGQHFVRFVAANGETMMRSETYTAKASARNCVASIQRNAPEAAVLEEI
nr:YegP family protein [Arsenicitalea aurantiaca]